MGVIKSNKEKHPLYNTWCYLKRKKLSENVSQEWLSDFWKFVEDVKERPGLNYRLYKKDKEFPLDKSNFYWKKVISCKNRALWMREYRKQNPEKFKKYEVQRRHLKYNEFLELKQVQNNKCAICKKEEHVLHLGKPRELAVDHCHNTGKIRGLLCTNCNKVLGHAKDSIEILTRAIEYLEESWNKSSTSAR